jgi:hypothetical protein
MQICYLMYPLPLLEQTLCSLCFIQHVTSSSHSDDLKISTKYSYEDFGTENINPLKRKLP